MQQLASRYATLSKVCRQQQVWAASTRLKSSIMMANSSPAVTQQQQLAMEGSAQEAAAQYAKVQVRMPADGTSITVSLVVAGKQRNLNRPRDEPLQKALFRLRASIQPPPSKNKKKKVKPGTSTNGDGAVNSSVDETPTPIVLYRDTAATQPIAEDVSNEQAWSSATLLLIGSDAYEVQLNAPHAERVVLPRRPMCGFPMLARAQLEFAQPEQCMWSWSRRAPGGSWQDLQCTSPLYTPTTGDIGHHLRVTCTPAASRPAPDNPSSMQIQYGQPVEAVSDVVQAAPANISARVRCGQDIPLAPVPQPGFRIISYNLLADQYAGSTYAQTVLFNYCPTENLDPDYRCQLILAEIQAYNADILCLQEVDARLFKDFLVPHLRLSGYEGHFTNKQGKVREGSATFWKTSRFRHVLSYDIKLRDVFKLPLAASHAQWQPMLDASPDLVHALQKVTTIAQASLLVPVEDVQPRPLCVVNTHLFYHPYAPHIRTMHTTAILEEVNALLNQLTALTQAMSEGSRPETTSDTGTTIAVPSAASRQQGAGIGQQAQPPASSTVNVSCNSGIDKETDTGCVEHLSGVVLDSSQASTQQHQDSLVQVARQLSGSADMPPTVLLCGDLNSDLNDGVPGVIELLQSGRLKADHWDWRMGANFRWGMNEEDGDAEQQAGAPQPPNSAIAAAVAAATAATSTGSQQQEGAASTTAAPATVAMEQAGGIQVSVVGIDVTAPYTLRSCDDLQTPFTNYTSGYKALLDYVWYQPEHLQVVQRLPVPDEQQLGSYIPSPVFPSDHLAVVYDLRPAAAATSQSC